MIETIHATVAVSLREMNSCDDIEDYVRQRIVKMLANELYKVAKVTESKLPKYSFTEYTCSVGIVPEPKSLNQMLSRAYREGMQHAADIAEESFWMNTAVGPIDFLTEKLYERNPYDK